MEFLKSPSLSLQLRHSTTGTLSPFRWLLAELSNGNVRKRHFCSRQQVLLPSVWITAVYGKVTQARSIISILQGENKVKRYWFLLQEGAMEKKKSLFSWSPLNTPRTQTSEGDGARPPLGVQTARADNPRSDSGAGRMRYHNAARTPSSTSCQNPYVRQ